MLLHFKRFLAYNQRRVVTLFCERRGSLAGRKVVRKPMGNSCKFADESFRSRVRDARLPLRGAFSAWLVSGICAFAFLIGYTDAQELKRETTAPAANINLASRTYYDGAETLGRVGHVAILRRDILHQIKMLHGNQVILQLYQ